MDHIAKLYGALGGFQVLQSLDAGDQAHGTVTTGHPDHVGATPHQLDQNTKVKQGPDGRYYVDQAVQADYRLLGFVGFVAAVLVSGMLIRRYLVSRYRLQLERTAIRQ